MSISLHSSDAPADLVKESFDLAIRLGTLADSGLKGRRIGPLGTIASARSAVLAGLRIRHLPLGDVAQDIEAGRLAQVLPEWSMPELGIVAVEPERGPQKALTRKLIDFLADGRSGSMGSGPEQVATPARRSACRCSHHDEMAAIT